MKQGDTKMRDYPKGVKRIYDDGGKSIDRYTVVYSPHYDHGYITKMWNCVGMSEHPFHPQGYGHHGACMLGRHLGKVINFSGLPEDCKKLVMQDLENIYEGRIIRG